MPSPPSGHAVVVAELFTSEGCSSCPPADALLSKLVHDQPLPLVEVVGLGEHVDYWDHLGWRDPYSSRVFSDRQSEYAARVFRTSGIYTPQIVIDGQYEAVGSDVNAIRRAIVHAANSPKAIVLVDATVQSDAQLLVHARVAPQPGVTLRGRADLVVAIAQDRLVDEVGRGENRGRRLAHSAVVRTLTALGSVEGPSPTMTASVMLSMAPDWKPRNMRAVAFLQERDSRRILGAGSVLLDRSIKEHT
jgi:hypothetical protein